MKHLTVWSWHGDTTHGEPIPRIIYDGPSNEYRQPVREGGNLVASLTPRCRVWELGSPREVGSR